MPSIEDLVHCWNCGTPFIDGGAADSRYCGDDCHQESRRAEAIKDYRSILQRHGAHSVEGEEFLAEWYHDHEFLYLADGERAKACRESAACNVSTRQVTH